MSIPPDQDVTTPTAEEPAGALGRTLRPEEVATRLDVPVRTVRYWLDTGRLHGHKRGQNPRSRWLIPEAAVERLERERAGLTVKEVADLLRMHPVSVRRLLARGRFKAHKVEPGPTGEWRIPRSEIEPLLADDPRQTRPSGS